MNLSPLLTNRLVLLLFTYISMVTVLSQCDWILPEIVLNPVTQTANPGSRVEFLVQANYGKNYAWYKDGELLTEQAEASLILENITSADAGVYRCSVSNDQGSVQSEPAELCVNDPPVIVRGFSPQTITEGYTLILMGEVAGTEPLAYRILKNNKLVAETTECYWQINGATVSDSGSWSFAVTNVTGVSLRSEAVEVVVNPIVVPEGEAEGELPLEGEPEPILCQQNFCATANSNDDTTAPISRSFCDCFANLYDNTPRNLLGVFAKLVDCFTPTGDMNGSSWVDKRADDDAKVTYQIGGNSLPDCSYEFQLIETVLLKPDFCICDSGLNHKLVHQAWAFNLNKLSEDFAGSYWNLVNFLLPGFQPDLYQILCANVTIGDGGADYSIDKYLTINGSGGFVLGVAYLLSKDIANPRPDLTTYQTLTSFFGPNGDADGDLWTNAEEYFIFHSSPEEYAAAALDPDIHP